MLYEYKFYRVPLETKAQGSNVDCKDDFYMVKDFLLSMTDNDWKFKQIVIPFDEKKGIYCTLGYEVTFLKGKNNIASITFGEFYRSVVQYIW